MAAGARIVDPVDCYANSYVPGACLRTLLSAGVDLASVDEHGETFVHDAAFFEDIEGLRLLLNAGADIDGRNEHTGNTALHSAVTFESMKSVRALIAAGAELDLQDDDGFTPLQLALNKGQYNAVLLAAAGADPRDLGDGRGAEGDADHAAVP